MARKRGKNEGSIFERGKRSKRGDGRWCGVVNLGWEGGKRRRKYIYGNTRKEVAEAVNKVLREQTQGLPVDTDRQTVAQFLEAWLENSAKPSVRPRTFANYRQLARSHIIPAVGHIRLGKLSAQHIQALLNRKVADGLSARTARHIHTVLRRALNQGLKWGLLPRNVATLVELPRLKRREMRPLNPVEARRFLAAAQGERLEVLYSVALSLGLRQGEALGLRWNDIDLDVGRLTVNQSAQRLPGAGIQFDGPKTDRSRRTIALPPTATAALRAHRTRQMRERLLAGMHWRETGLVFTSRIGTPLEPRNVFRDFKRVLAKAGLPSSIRFHDLRHSCASLLLAQGANLRVIMELLGHSQISITANTYAHVVPELMRDAAHRMEAVLFGDTGSK